MLECVLCDTACPFPAIVAIRVGFRYAQQGRKRKRVGEIERDVYAEWDGHTCHFSHVLKEHTATHNRQVIARPNHISPSQKEDAMEDEMVYKTDIFS